MTSSDMLSINNVAAKLGLSVHQLRRWELMFGLEIKRGRGQQRQYREEDMSVLERIKELVEQGWPTSQIRPQLEAEGLLTPKLIGVPPNPGNPEVLQEAIIGLRNFSERRFIDLSKQIDELRQLVISVTLKQELSSDKSSPWQPMTSEYVPAPKASPPQEITIGPQIGIDPPKSQSMPPAPMSAPPARVNQIPPPPAPAASPVPPATTAPSAPAASIAAPSSSSFGTSSSSENKVAIPDIDAAPKPITDALQKSMSTLDGLFRESRGSTGGLPGDISPSTPAAPANPLSPSTAAGATASTTSSPSLPPVRHSTIPPLPSSTAASTENSETPSISSSPANPVLPTPAPAPAAAPPVERPSFSSFAGSPANPINSVSSTSSTPSLPSVSTPSPTSYGSTSSSGSSLPAAPAAPATPAAPASAWDQAFASTTVDANAVPSSGLFEDNDQPTLKAPPGAPASPNAYGAPAKPESESNPFTTITGTNINAIGQNLSQTGPLPAHTSVENFAPATEKLIESQSSSTSTDLPETAVAPVPPPALPVTPGPQVNFGPNVSPPTPGVTPQKVDDNFGLGEVTDQNYLTVLGRALDLIGWSDEQADSYSLKTFGVPHWDELGRSQAEKLVAHLVGLLKDQLNG